MWQQTANSFAIPPTYQTELSPAHTPESQPLSWTARSTGLSNRTDYRLIAARACPWAHRTVIVRSLLGLDKVISLGLAAPTHDVRSWNFDLDQLV